MKLSDFLFDGGCFVLVVVVFSSFLYIPPWALGPPGIRTVNMPKQGELQKKPTLPSKSGAGASAG